jgi:hypothetical protein
MSHTKLSLGGNNLYMTSLFPPRESLVSDIPAGDGKTEKLFLRCPGVVDLGGKWKKSSIRKILVILFGHFFLGVELTYR